MAQDNVFNTALDAFKTTAAAYTPDQFSDFLKSDRGQTALKRHTNTSDETAAQFTKVVEATNQAILKANGGEYPHIIIFTSVGYKQFVTYAIALSEFYQERMQARSKATTTQLERKEITERGQDLGMVRNIDNLRTGFQPTSEDAYKWGRHVASATNMIRRNVDTAIDTIIVDRLLSEYAIYSKNLFGFQADNTKANLMKSNFPLEVIIGAENLVFAQMAKPENRVAIAILAEMKRTGNVELESVTPVVGERAIPENETKVSRIMRERRERRVELTTKGEELERVRDEAKRVMDAAQGDLDKVNAALQSLSDIDAKMEGYVTTQAQLEVVRGEQKKLFGDGQPPEGFNYKVLELNAESEVPLSIDDIKQLAAQVDYVPKIYGLGEVPNESFLTFKERMAQVVKNINLGMYDDDHEAATKAQKFIKQFVSDLQEAQLRNGRQTLINIQQPIPVKQEPDAEEVAAIEAIQGNAISTLANLQTKTPITFTGTPAPAASVANTL